MDFGPEIELFEKTPILYSLTTMPGGIYCTGPGQALYTGPGQALYTGPIPTPTPFMNHDVSSPTTQISEGDIPRWCPLPAPLSINTNENIVKNSTLNPLAEPWLPGYPYLGKEFDKKIEIINYILNLKDICADAPFSEQKLDDRRLFNRGPTPNFIYNAKPCFVPRLAKSAGPVLPAPFKPPLHYEAMGTNSTDNFQQSVPQNKPAGSISPWEAPVAANTKQQEIFQPMRPIIGRGLQCRKETDPPMPSPPPLVEGREVVKFPRPIYSTQHQTK